MSETDETLTEALPPEVEEAIHHAMNEAFHIGRRDRPGEPHSALDALRSAILSALRARSTTTGAPEGECAECERLRDVLRGAHEVLDRADVRPFDARVFSADVIEARISTLVGERDGARSAKSRDAAHTESTALISERLRRDFERIYEEEAPTMDEHERALARRFVDSIAQLAGAAAERAVPAAAPERDPDERVKKGFRIGVEAAARWIEGQETAPHFTAQLRYTLASAIRFLAAPASPPERPAAPSPHPDATTEGDDRDA